MYAAVTRHATVALRRGHATLASHASEAARHAAHSAATRHTAHLTAKPGCSPTEGATSSIRLESATTHTAPLLRAELRSTDSLEANIDSWTTKEPLGAVRSTLLATILHHLAISLRHTTPRKLLLAIEFWLAASLLLREPDTKILLGPRLLLLGTSKIRGTVVVSTLVAAKRTTVYLVSESAPLRFRILIALHTPVLLHLPRREASRLIIPLLVIVIGWLSESQNKIRRL